MQQRLYKRGVAWQNQEHLFIFQGLDDEDTPREIEWVGRKRDKRTVFKTELKKKSGDFLRHKHFAFKAEFERFGNKWYVSIKPDWFFSNRGGYKKSYYHDDAVSYLKRNEYNQHVASHVRFLAFFLSKDSPTTSLFPDDTGFLTYGDLVSFTDAPYLNDSTWNQNESKQKQTTMSESDGGLFADEVV